MDYLRNTSKQDKMSYAVLIGGFLVFLVGFWRFRFDPTKAFWVLFLASAYYVVWGVVYHNIRGDFERKILIEYLIVAGISFVAAFLVFIV